MSGCMRTAASQVCSFRRRASRNAGRYLARAFLEGRVGTLCMISDGSVRCNASLSFTNELYRLCKWIVAPSFVRIAQSYTTYPVLMLSPTFAHPTSCTSRANVRSSFPQLSPIQMSLENTERFAIDPGGETRPLVFAPERFPSSVVNSSQNRDSSSIRSFTVGRMIWTSPVDWAKG